METTFESIMAKRREEHEAKMREIQLKEAELQKQKNMLKAEFKAGNRALNQLCNHPTAKSIATQRKRNAYNIKRFIGGKLSEWECPYLNGAEAVVGFKIEDGKIVLNVEVPFKHSSYEDQFDLF